MTTLSTIIKRTELSNRELADLATVAIRTVDRARGGVKVSDRSARKIYAACTATRPVPEAMRAAFAAEAGIDAVDLDDLERHNPAEDAVDNRLRIAQAIGLLLQRLPERAVADLVDGLAESFRQAEAMRPAGTSFNRAERILKDAEVRAASLAHKPAEPTARATIDDGPTEQPLERPVATTLARANAIARAVAGANGREAPHGTHTGPRALHLPPTVFVDDEGNPWEIRKIYPVSDFLPPNELAPASAEIKADDKHKPTKSTG